jgi:hypothetical protein
MVTLARASSVLVLCDGEFEEPIPPHKKKTNKEAAPALNKIQNCLL